MIEGNIFITGLNMSNPYDGFFSLVLPKSFLSYLDYVAYKIRQDYKHFRVLFHQGKQSFRDILLLPQRHHLIFFLSFLFFVLGCIYPMLFLMPYPFSFLFVHFVCVPFLIHLFFVSFHQSSTQTLFENVFPLPLLLKIVLAFFVVNVLSFLLVVFSLSCHLVAFCVVQLQLALTVRGLLDFSIFFYVPGTFLFLIFLYEFFPKTRLLQLWFYLFLDLIYQSKTVLVQLVYRKVQFLVFQILNFLYRIYCILLENVYYDDIGPLDDTNVPIFVFEYCEMNQYNDGCFPCKLSYKYQTFSLFTTCNNIVPLIIP